MKRNLKDIDQYGYCIMSIDPYKYDIRLVRPLIIWFIALSHCLTDLHISIIVCLPVDSHTVHINEDVFVSSLQIRVKVNQNEGVNSNLV